MDDVFSIEPEDFQEDVCCATCALNVGGFCKVFEVSVDDESRCGSWVSELQVDPFLF